VNTNARIGSSPSLPTPKTCPLTFLLTQKNSLVCGGDRQPDFHRWVFPSNQGKRRGNSVLPLESTHPILCFVPEGKADLMDWLKSLKVVDNAGNTFICRKPDNKLKVLGDTYRDAQKPIALLGELIIRYIFDTPLTQVCHQL
jgi:hypothetical protein